MSQFYLYLFSRVFVTFFLFSFLICFFIIIFMWWFTEALIERMLVRHLLFFVYLIYSSWLPTYVTVCWSDDLLVCLFLFCYDIKFWTIITPKQCGIALLTYMYLLDTYLFVVLCYVYCMFSCLISLRSFRGCIHVFCRYVNVIYTLSLCRL